MEFSIVIRVHNEEGSIVSLANEIFLAVPAGHTFEVLCVDDGSSNQTNNVLDDLSSQNRQVRYVKLEKQCGQRTANG